MNIFIIATVLAAPPSYQVSSDNVPSYQVSSEQVGTPAAGVTTGPSLTGRVAVLPAPSAPSPVLLGWNVFGADGSVRFVPAGEVPVVIPFGQPPAEVSPPAPLRSPPTSVGGQFHMGTTGAPSVDSLRTSLTGGYQTEHMFIGVPGGMSGFISYKDKDVLINCNSYG